VAPAGPLTVLLVDDHEAVRETTAAMLADMGHEVIAAASGPEALDLFKQRSDSIDILVTDYAMPEISGVEVVQQIRKLAPEFPAVVVTGNADTGAMDGLPTVRTLTKPFSPALLNQVIALTLDKQAADDAGAQLDRAVP
jgi:CheY-like chemotaxis protein